ncbi:MAG: hypothetical protein AAF714_07235 [Pseudomonadota bacterium]
MRRQANLRRRVTPTQRAAGWPSALAWAAIGPLACFAMLVCIALAVWDQPVQDARQFQGVLRPVATPIGVDLPKNAVLEQIVVSQGDVIRKGETLALLDLGEMHRQHRAKFDALLAARADYLCQTSKDMDAFHASLRRLEIEARHDLRKAAVEGGFLAHEDHDLSGALNSALACEIAHDALAATRTHDADMLAAAANRAELLSRQIAVLIERQSLAGVSQAEKSALAVEVLETMLEQNQLQRDVTSFEARLAASDLSLERDKAQKARALSQVIIGLDHDVRALEALIASRRLTSPITGIVVRVRDPGPGHGAVARERIMELARAGGKNFRLAITVPPDEIARLRDGAQVELTLAGAVGAPPLGGTLDLDRPLNGIERTPDTVMVNLSGSARSWLASAAGTVALSGGATASTVRLRLDPADFGEILQRAGRTLRPKPWSLEDLGATLQVDPS